MRTLLTISLLFFCTSCLLPGQQASPLYKLPQSSVKSGNTPAGAAVIAGAESGLYSITEGKTAVPLWTNGKVSRMVRTEQIGADSNVSERWFFVTSEGILTTTDLKTFEFRNN